MSRRQRRRHSVTATLAEDASGGGIVPQTLGPQSPSAFAIIATGTESWASPQLAYVNSGTYVVPGVVGDGDESDTVAYTGFDMLGAGPAVGTVSGILVEVEIADLLNNGGSLDLQLYWGSSLQGDIKQITPAFGLGNIAYHSGGGAADLWGAAPTIGDINDAGFGVTIHVVDSEPQTRPAIDHIQITVYTNQE